MEKRPLYVRLPTAAAEKLDRAAFELRTPKQDLVAQLLENHLTVGRHAFFPNDDAEVLTLEEAAELLRSDAATVKAMAEDGSLPGRKVGDDWRFTRAAILHWLAGDDDQEED
jgi:excisionase family DNA binding protein